MYTVVFKKTIIIERDNLVFFLKLLFQASGIYLPLIRFSEQSFSAKMADEFRSVFFFWRWCKRKDSDKVASSKSSSPEDGMAPLFMFLASSFNVELVYIILKGITQFSYLTCLQQDAGLSSDKRSKLSLTEDKDRDEARITLSKIKIKNVDSWSSQRHQDFI
jgi:hypothetical protein